jgi:ParB-like chromosome segregation protein Spo0J
MNLVDKRKGYIFQEELTNRSKELQESIRKFSLVIWPIIIKRENFELVDGYCRYTSLKAMNVSRIYAYVGT